MEESGFPVGEAPESVFRSVTEAEVSLDEMLSLACRQGKQDIVELLLESGANVNHRNKAGNTPLLEACSQGHVSIAQLLLDRNANIDAPTETTYDSALTWACTLGNEEIVALLLERNANVEHRTKDGCTALMFAALAGHERVAKLLLDHSAEINVESDSNKDSPLTFACWKGHQKVVELFLQRKADIEHRTKEGFSPLMFAALGGHTQVAELLLKHSAQVNMPSGSNNDIPLTSACWKGHHHVVCLLLRFNSNIEHRTKDGCTPLMLAAREGHFTVAQLLLEHGAKVNMPSGSENNIPLTLACWKGHRDVVELLLKHSSNIEHQNKAGCTPLMLAAREGHYEATLLLLNSGAQINVPSGSNDDTPLTLACWKGHENVVLLLIGKNSNVNHQTKTGCTPLMEATREGHVGVARMLLEAGADVETPDNYGQSPFFMACWKGHADVAALLLLYDANKDCRTKTGITPLFQACRENHVEVVKLLLDYGCNPSTPFPNSRECPLTLASEKGYSDLAQLLVARNANIESRTKKGSTPFFLACKEGYKDISVMLAKHGADTEATDYRGTTPLLSAFRSGHVELVDWLLGHVTHLPSDIECQRALVAPMPPDTDLLPRRSKSFEMIMKAKKAREQAALRNAQSLFEELDAEEERRESKKKAAAKKRSKRKEKKRREQAEKMEATQQGVEERLSVEGREEPDGESSLTPPPLSPSPQAASPTAERAADVPDDTSGMPPQKKRRSRKKRKKKDRTEEAPPTEEAEPDDSNDSADEVFHDAQSDLPDFYPPESLVTKQQSVIAMAPACIEAPPPTSDEKLSVAKQTPTTRGRIEEPPKTMTAVPDRERSSQSIHEKALKIIADSKSVSVEEKNRSNKSIRPEKPDRVPPKNQKSKSSKPEKSTAAVGAMTAPTTITRKIEVFSSEQKVYPVHQVLPVSRSKNHGGEVHRQERSGSVKSSKEADIRESSKMGTWDSKKLGRADMSVAGKQGEGLAWNKAVGRPHSNQDSTRVSPPSPGGSHMTEKTNQIRTPSQPSNQTQSSFVAKSQQPESSWTSSQDSMSDWGEEEMDPEELQVISRCRTDDDKIRSQKLREAAVATVTIGTGTAVSRPAATTATPTPTLATVASASTFQPWQEVTRTTRTVQLSVANTLVGRVIGRGGARINNIQEDSGAHINVSRNIPKSTERLITIKGTQRSVTRAQELIEEALSTPDREIDPTVPSPPPTVTYPRTISPEGSKDNPPTPTPSLTHTSIRPSGQKKRNYDIVPPNPSELRAPWTSSFQPAQNRSSTSSSTLPSQRTPVPVSAPTTVSESSTYVPTNAVTTARSSLSEEDLAINVSHESRPRVCAWQVVGEGTVRSSRPGTRGTKSISEGEGDRSLGTSSLPASPDASDELSANNCGRNQEHDWEQSHRSPPSSFSPDPTSSAPASVSSLEDLTPSLSIHSRSKSDPQVSSEQIRERLMPAKWGNQGLPISQLSQTRHFSPSMPAISSPTTEGDRVLSLDDSTSEKVSADLKESVGSKVPSHGTMTGFTQSGTGGELSGITKTTKNVAVIQPTQHHQVTVSSSTFPTTTHASATSSLPTRAYGAVVAGRRSSTPATQVAFGTIPSPHSQRKVSYAGLQWSHAPMRPMTYLPTAMEGSPVEFSRLPPSGLPPSGPHPPTANAWKTPHMAHTSSSFPPGWFSPAAEGERTRSLSWAGLPGAGGPFAPGGIPAYPAQVVPVYLPRPPSQEAPHPSIPDTPHGENLVGEPWSESDFSVPAGVYGAIGSGVRTTTSSAPGVKHAPIRGYASAPPNTTKSTVQGSDNIWSHPGSSNVVYPNPLASLHGFQQLSQQQHIPSSARPFGPTPTSVYTHARVVAGQKSHAPSWVSDSLSPGQATHAGHQDDPPPSNPGTTQKRWSVPSMVCSPQQSFHPNLARQPESQSWSSGNIHGQSTATELGHKAGYASTGEQLSLSDPWTNWGGDGSATSTGGGGGSLNATNPTSVSSETWQPSPLSPGQDSKSSRSMFRRGVAVGVATPWSSGPLASQEGGDGASDLQQLMKSLDISEHLHVLKDRKLSLQQLHSMSDEEWRSLKLPVGPRVKLINAVSNIARSGNGNKPPAQGSSTTAGSEPASPSESLSTGDVLKTQTDDQLYLQETFQ